jgi:hypothetical protein
MDPATTAALIQAGGSILGGVAGGLIGGGGDKFPSLKDKLSPYGRDQLLGAWDAYDALGPMPYYPGETYAGLSDRQKAALDSMARFGTGEGPGGRRVQDMIEQGVTGLEGLNRAADFHAGLAAQGAPQFQFDQATFDQIYNNPNLQGMIEGATRDIFRDTMWNQLPGLNQAASGSGNAFSSGRDLTSGMLQGMAMDRASDVAANIYGNAFNQAVSGGMTGGTQSLGSQMDTNALISGGLLNQANVGLPGQVNAYNFGRQHPQDRLTVGNIYQQNQQNQIGADMARWNFETQAPYNFANAQMGQALAVGGLQRPDGTGARCRGPSLSRGAS